MKTLIEGIEVEIIDGPTVPLLSAPIYHVTLESGMIATGPASWAEEDSSAAVIASDGEVLSVQEAGDFPD